MLCQPGCSGRHRYSHPNCFQQVNSDFWQNICSLKHSDDKYLLNLFQLGHLRGKSFYVQPSDLQINWCPQSFGIFAPNSASLLLLAPVTIQIQSYPSYLFLSYVKDVCSLISSFFLWIHQNDVCTSAHSLWAQPEFWVKIFILCFVKTKLVVKSLQSIS